MQSKWNFLNHLVTDLGSTSTSSFVRKMFLFASAALWPSTSSQIRLLYTFICAAFKSYVKWSKAHVRTPTTFILSTTAGTYHCLNCFSHMICSLQTSMYKDIVKLLTHSYFFVFCCWSVSLSLGPKAIDSNFLGIMQESRQRYSCFLSTYLFIVCV